MSPLSPVTAAICPALTKTAPGLCWTIASNTFHDANVATRAAGRFSRARRTSNTVSYGFLIGSLRLDRRRRAPLPAGSPRSRDTRTSGGWSACTELPDAGSPAIDPCSVESDQKNGMSFRRRSSGWRPKAFVAGELLEPDIFRRACSAGSSTSRPPNISSVRAPSNVTSTTRSPALAAVWQCRLSPRRSGANSATTATREARSHCCRFAIAPTAHDLRKL